MAFFLKPQKIGPLPPIPNPYPSRFQDFRRRVNYYASFAFVALLFSTLFFPTYRERLSELTLDFSALVISFIETPVMFAKDTFQDAKSLATLKEEVSQLKAQLHDLRDEATQLKQIKFEHEALKAYLRVPIRPAILFHTVSVMAQPHGGIVHNLFVDFGGNDGAIKGQGVMNEDGVVGRLNVVGSNSSRVRLLTDPSSRIPVYLPRLHKKAILAGDGSPYPKLVYIQGYENLKENDTIVTSGVGGVFPYGIPVGQVRNLSSGIASVQLMANPEDSFFLQVLETGSTSLEAEEGSKSES